MKIRHGFVSNSSSSSFILDVTDLSEDQKNKIENYRDELLRMINEKEEPFYSNSYDVKWITRYFYEYRNIEFDEFFDNVIKKSISWEIKKLSEDRWSFSTLMDNFDFVYFLIYLGIIVDGPNSKIKDFDGHSTFFNKS